ncbi:MAG: hypothetical protein PHI93_06985 [Kiritimatiellae bacterium]|jgi:hypothetical protein|nr:hypothetical protein [Kiritimatiellia bacterium]MDY0148889.1 hypothetical protein [Kiritimatiellia bacterium]
MKKNKLDSVLKAWGERNQPDAETQARLESRICDLPVPEPGSASPRMDPRPIHWAQGRWAAAAAVLVLAGTLGWMVFRSGLHPEAQCAEQCVTQKLARFTEQQVSGHLAILDEVETLFPGQIRWVRLDEDGMQLQMDEKPAPVEAARPRMAVRMVMVARQENQDHWETVWSSDVLARTEEYIEISPNKGIAGEVGVWVLPLADGRYAVDSEIVWAASDGPASYETRILSAGQPEQILSQTTAGLETRIYQTVEPLMNGNG